MNKVEQLIHEQYTELIKVFKPQFGNMRHIQISQEAAKLNKLQKEYEAKIEANSDLKKLRDDVRKQKRNILYLLKNQ